MYISGLHISPERFWQLGVTLLAGACIALSVVATANATTIVLLCIFGIVWMVSMVILSRRGKLRMQLEEIERLRTGKASYYSTDDLMKYRGVIRNVCESQPIDRETILDLDIPQLHEASNATLTLTGETTLYSMYANPTTDSGVVSLRRKALERLSRNDTEKIFRLLHRIGRERHADVANLLFGDAPTTDPRFPFYIVQCISTLILTVLAISGVFYVILPLVLMVFINGITYFRSAVAFTDLLPRFTTLVRIVETADYFSGDSGLSTLSEWSHSKKVPRIKRLTGVAGFLTFAPENIGNLLEIAMLMLKAFLLLDALAYHSLAKRVVSCGDLLKTAYTFVGQVDALQALSVYRETLSECCEPEEIVGTSGVKAIGIYHPLVEDAVSNDVDLRSPGWVLTGANMSGKSTLLRTIMLNVVLAKTIGFCCATSFACSRLRLASLIRKSDSIAEGKSLYFYEARRIFDMIQSAATGEPLLLAVDEFFAGTNSKERIAAAVAVLIYLEKLGCLTIAATHDLEVALRLEGTYKLFHFADNIADGEIQFDYTLQDGHIRSTNGLRLLRLIGYPEEVVSIAENMQSETR